MSSTRLLFLFWQTVLRSFRIMRKEYAFLSTLISWSMRFSYAKNHTSVGKESTKGMYFRMFGNHKTKVFLIFWSKLFSILIDQMIRNHLLVQFVQPWLDPCGSNDQFVVHSNLAKNGWTKRSSKREAKLRVKKNSEIFDAKLRSALLASLCSSQF